MRRTIDLNADVGEGFDTDWGLFDVITSANVACGFHAGDADTMRTCCELAVAAGVAVGAQVSYRDRAGFGRREVEIAAPALLLDLEEQLAALRAAASAAGTEVRYVKPHGALYNRIVWDAEQATAVVDLASRNGLPLLGLPGSQALALAASVSVPTFREFFADRAYTDGGTLVPRSDPDAVIGAAEQVAARTVRMVAAGVVRSVNDRDVGVGADSVCVHGDTPGAVELARSVRVALEGAGCVVRPFA
jgi:UPF0271 protein